VAGGNVETSQRIADAVALALAQAITLPAQSQATMNNLTLGNEDFNYYETLGGGAGASEGHDGASGIHVGTTNTMNTPVEALEMAFPLRVERYEFRSGSGGAGRWRGGEGVVRSLRLLQAARMSLLTDRRRHGPRGAAGGEAGRPGRNLVNGREVGGKVTMQLAPGDTITIETPGGGGYGKPG
jgi:N-methylhydantoinase B